MSLNSPTSAGAVPGRGRGWKGAHLGFNAEFLGQCKLPRHGREGPEWTGPIPGPVILGL